MVCIVSKKGSRAKALSRKERLQTIGKGRSHIFIGGSFKIDAETISHIIFYLCGFAALRE